MKIKLLDIAHGRSGDKGDAANVGIIAYDDNGYNIIKTRVKWGDVIERVRFTQSWGSKFIHFTNKSSAISKLSSNNNALLELKWHGQDQIYFDFPLKGSTAAIAEIRKICRGQ